MAIYALDGHVPKLHNRVFVADAATLIGRVTAGEGCSFWPGVTVRADNDFITLATNTNVQDGAVLHADPGFPLRIGSNVTIGHQAMLHGCTVEDGALIGIQAVVLNGAVIGRNCLVGAGALVTEGKTFPDNSLIIGSPARAVREVSAEMLTKMHADNAYYVDRSDHYRRNLSRVD
ncbi:MAG: gamma carbonic anhydrase family protein [Pseudomonadota bacterium]